MTKQFLQIKLNLNGLLRRPYGTPRNDVIIDFGIVAFILVPLLFGFLFPSASFAQTGLPVIIKADSTAGTQINGEPVKQLFGHFRFVQGATYGSSDNATQFLVQNKIELNGNVEIHQDTLALYAPHVIYNNITGLGHADGNVRLFDRDNELTAADGDYDMDRQVAHFHHHVTVTQGKSTSLSDNLVYYRATQTNILLGHAEVKSDSGSLTADTIIYVRALDETSAFGNVHLTNDSLHLASDWFYNSGSRGEMDARGHVIVLDVNNQTTVFGDTLTRFAATNCTIVPKRPLLEYIDSSQVRDTTGKVNTVFDTMFVRADTMKMYQGDSAHFLAIDSVRLLRSNFSLVGGRLLYDQVHETMNVWHSPRQHVWNDSTEIDADSVSMLMKEHHIKRVFAVGHAFMTDPMEEAPNTGRVNQLEGDNMMLVIEQDTARRLYDMVDALSIYFLLSDNKPDGVNRASGDTIRIDFKEHKVIRLAIISGTEGEYFPERFVNGRAAAFRLSAYERHDHWKPLREEFVVPWKMQELTQPQSTTGEPAQSPKR